MRLSIITGATWLLIVLVAYAVFWIREVSGPEDEFLYLWILAPGLLLDMYVSGNVHGGAGGVAGLATHVLGSWLFWTLGTLIGVWIVRFVYVRVAGKPNG